ncbi:MAG TPA: S8 family serine peptidase [Pyrinomonadaceae bacterium]|nr:S8 family serine peptidase [Pyrinomonadaceae bacterium]
MPYKRIVNFKKSRSVIALILIVLLSVIPVLAGVTVTGSNGITATGADGVQYIGTSGITATGADGALLFGPNGITATGADGITATGADGITATGADGFTYTGANGITATGADSLNIVRADGITATGADGITATGADGTTYQLDSIDFRFPTGITATGADGITATGADGITATGADGITATGADGITATGADGVTISSASGITATGADGHVTSIPAGALSLVGADLIVAVNSQGIQISGASTISQTGIDALTSLLLQGTERTGLQSVDPELAASLGRLTDDSTINAVVVYHRLPTETDLADLQRIGIAGGTRFRALPMVIVTGTRSQIIAVSQLPAVRSIYGNRTLSLTSEPEVRSVTGVDRAWRDADLTVRNASLPISGRNVTVAVLDTGIDATQADLSGKVMRNIKLADTQSVGNGFSYPVNAEGLPNTDQLYGHGTFVAGVIAGTGIQSNGKFKGVAPGASLLGLSAGDLTLLYVLAGFDYLLVNAANQRVRVVNCSFSANTVFDTNDPVNVATRMLTDNGINVVFSSGNTGPGQHTLNPYSVAPWVVGVGATDTAGHLANFSSRGDFASGLFHPTLVAPGVDIVSLRGSGITNVIGAQGLAGADALRLTASELPYYTTSSGTSFSAPQVAGTIALMLEANPQLTPAEVRDILQLTATPLAPYYEHEAGAGMLNAHAAVLASAFPARRLGAWRSALDRRQVEFFKDPLTSFNGSVSPGGTFETTVQIPENTVFASIQIGWGPLLSTNDLALYVYDQSGNLRGQSNVVNIPGLTGRTERVSINLPSSGTWRIRVRNGFGFMLNSQQFSGLVQFGRARYGPMNDISNLQASVRDDIYGDLRSFTMWPIGSRFRPDFAISRLDLATALVLGSRVPQYVADQAVYRDVADSGSRSFVESCQASPAGALFIDTSAGGSFRPNDAATRLAAAVALVRAAGLRGEAEAVNPNILPFVDAASIPIELRGYVSVAITRGLLQTGDNFFRPQVSLTRSELAHAMAVIQRRATQ